VKRIVKKNTGGKDCRIVEIQLSPQGSHPRDQLKLTTSQFTKTSSVCSHRSPVRLWSSRCKNFVPPPVNGQMIDQFPLRALRGRATGEFPQSHFYYYEGCQFPTSKIVECTWSKSNNLEHEASRHWPKSCKFLDCLE
jgi:hypothetical protein